MLNHNKLINDIKIVLVKNSDLDIIVLQKYVLCYITVVFDLLRTQKSAYFILAALNGLLVCRHIAKISSTS